MILEQALVTYLLTKTAITNLVAARIYPIRRPQGQAVGNSLVYTRVSATRIRSFGGPSGLTNARIQFDCWGTGAKPYQSAKELADALRLTLDVGLMQGGRVQIGGASGVWVQACKLDDGAEQDLEDPPVNASDTSEFRVSQDYVIWFEE